MSFKEFLLDVLDRTVNASWYRSVGCSPDEASFLADMEANSRNTSRRSRQLSDEEIKTRIEESRKGYDEAMATLAECQRKLREGGPLVREGRKKLVRKPCAFAKKQERRTVNLSLLRWYAYFPPYGFGLFCSHRIYSHRIKRSPIRKGRVSLDKAAQQKREDDPSSRFQHIELLISSYISRVPRWKAPSPCRSRCGQSFRGA